MAHRPGGMIGAWGGTGIIAQALRRFVPRPDYRRVGELLSQYYDPSTGGFTEAAFEQLPENVLQIAEYVNQAEQALPEAIQGPNTARYGQIIDRIQARRERLARLEGGPAPAPSQKLLLSNRKFRSFMKCFVVDTGNSLINNKICFTAPFPCKVSGFIWKGGIEFCDSYPVTLSVGMKRILDGNPVGAGGLFEGRPNVTNTIITNDGYRSSELIWEEVITASPADNALAPVASGGDFDGFSSRWAFSQTNTSRRLMSNDSIAWFIDVNSTGPTNTAGIPWPLPGIAAVNFECQFIVTFKKS